MFVIGRVEVPGGKHDASRVLPAAARGDRAHRFQETIRIAVHRSHAELLEQFRAQPHHRLAVFQHVADPRGRTRIVLQHEEFVRPGADQIDAADMRPDAVRRTNAQHLGPELRIEEDQVLGQHARLQDLLRAINVVKKGVDRLDALHQPLGKPRPFIGEEDARDDVEGDDPLAGVIVAIDGEGDAELAKGRLGRFLSAAEFIGRRIGEPAGKVGQFGARRAA